MERVASLDSLAEFFGVAGSLEFEDLEFESNTITFDVDIGGTNVWFKFTPQTCRASLNLRVTPFGVMRLALTDVSHVAIRKTSEAHYLELPFYSGAKPLELFLRPHLLLFWGNGEEGPSEPHLEAVDA